MVGVPHRPLLPSLPTRRALIHGQPTRQGASLHLSSRARLSRQGIEGGALECAPLYTLFFFHRCRANIAQIRQSRPDSELGSQVQFLKVFEVVPSWLGSG